MSLRGLSKYAGSPPQHCWVYPCERACGCARVVWVNSPPEGEEGQRVMERDGEKNRQEKWRKSHDDSDPVLRSQAGR